jgi:two-component system catabolic regulation response regulator CreB
MDAQHSVTDNRTGRAAALRVLIVEDGATMAAAIAAALREARMDTRIATTGAEAIAAKAKFHPHVVLVDLELPDVSGMHLVARFAHEADCGVIVVTVNGAEATRIAGLETGADDYIVKPAALRELAARIRAVHRRLYRPDPEPARPAGPTLTMDHARRLLIGANEASVTLTEAEAGTLDALLDANGASVSRQSLGVVALKRPLHADDRSVDQLVLKLRRKIASLGASERTILSARRRGYMIPDPSRFRQLPAPRAG